MCMNIKDFGMKDLKRLRDVGSRPIASAGIVAATSDDAEETFLAPVAAPAVAADPIICTVLSAPSIDLDSMVSHPFAGFVHIYTTCVILKTFTGVGVGD